MGIFQKMEGKTTKKKFRKTGSVVTENLIYDFFNIKSSFIIKKNKK